MPNGTWQKKGKLFSWEVGGGGSIHIFASPPTFGRVKNGGSLLYRTCVRAGLISKLPAFTCDTTEENHASSIFHRSRSLPISGERNRHERASFVDPGIERGDERWLSVPLSPFLFILVRVGARRGRRRAKSQEAEGEEEFPPLSFFFAGGGTGLKNRHPTGASNKKPGTFPSLPPLFQTAVFSSLRSTDVGMEAKEKGLLFLPRFFSPSRLFRPPPTLPFSTKRDWGLFFLPASRAVEEEEREKRKAGKREKSGKVFFSRLFLCPLV